jgi:hypothetical protein
VTENTWNRARQQSLLGQLSEFWKEDIWDMRTSPLQTRLSEKTKQRRLRFGCKSATVNGELKVVVPTSAVGTVQLDGAAVTSSGFSVIGSSTYSGAAVQISPGTHHFTAAAPFGVTLYGYATADTFGYQAGMVLDTARAGTTVTLTPSAVTQLTGTQLCAVASVLDPYGAAVGGVGVGFTITGANTSSQTVDTTATGQASYCYSGNNLGTDTILASVGLASATSTITWSASAPNRAPAVYAGGNQTINLPAVANPSTASSMMTDCLREERSHYHGRG